MSPNPPANAMLTALSGARAFIVFRKSDKCPVDTEGRAMDAQQSANWMLPDQAQAWAFILGDGYGVGLVLRPELKIFCVDIDHALVNGQWSPLAVTLCHQFAGCAIEVSMSSTGLHIFGRYVGDMPPHKSKNVALGIECYHEARYIALTGTNLIGDVNHDCTALLPQFIAQYFTQADDSSVKGEWTDGPLWHVPGTADDAELIRKMRASRSTGAMFSSRASVEQLWTADADALGKFFPPNSAHQLYDASSADQALANHVIWWTGGDCERTDRIMRQSALLRDKWDHRADYLTDTICDALSFAARNPPQAKASVDVPGNTVTAPPPPTSIADPYLTRVDRTDQGNANLLILLAGGNLRYVAETKHWLRWDGQRWQIDTHEVFVTKFALEVARHYLDESKRLYALAKEPGHGDAQVAADDAAKWASKSRNKSAIDNMITLARKVPGVPISVVELDRKPYLLGVDNGVVDLRSGELHESEAREDYVTKRSPVKFNPSATAPRWEALIAQATGAPLAAERDASGAVIAETVGRYVPRPALAQYLHKALGYSATGETREQKLFFGIGEGSNGKGLIFDTTKTLLGPYAVALPSEALMASKHGSDAERPTALAAKLAGARFVVASESKEGQKLDVATIKAQTGDSEMTARRMRENPFTFTITHKIWLLTNVRPAIDHLDAATKGRLHLVPFDRRWNRPGEFERDPALPDGDKGLMAQLAAEAEGILASLVRAAVLYYREGLSPPPEVIEKTREYVMEQDHFGRWLATMQRCPAKQGTGAAELFAQFSQWCAAEGCVIDPSNLTAFGRALRSRRIETLHNMHGNRWGLRMLQVAPPPPNC